MGAGERSERESSLSAGFSGNRERRDKTREFRIFRFPARRREEAIAISTLLEQRPGSYAGKEAEDAREYQ